MSRFSCNVSTYHPGGDPCFFFSTWSIRIDDSSVGVYVILRNFGQNIIYKKIVIAKEACFMAHMTFTRKRLISAHWSYKIWSPSFSTEFNWILHNIRAYRAFRYPGSISCYNLCTYNPPIGLLYTHPVWSFESVRLSAYRVFHNLCVLICWNSFLMMSRSVIEES